jgi:hypothetical protein
MRFFVAKGTPQNDGGFVVAWKLRWRFALDGFVARAAAEKRRQSRRTLQWAGCGDRLGRCAGHAVAGDALRHRASFIFHFLFSIFRFLKPAGAFEGVEQEGY